MKQILPLIYLLFFLSNCSNPSTEISMYSEFVEHPKYGIGTIDLKKEIPDGNYIVIDTDKCGNKDTLLMGTIKNGKREGIWYFYEYFGLQLDSCNLEINLKEKDIYENGKLISCEDYTLGTVTKIIYQKNQEQHGGEKLSIAYNYENGSRTLVSSTADNNQIVSEFDKNKILRTQTHIVQDTYFIKEYHLSGVLSDEYKMVITRVDGKAVEYLDGISKTWDEQGVLIDEITYDMKKLPFNE